jgi:hypothetical protein
VQRPRGKIMAIEYPVHMEFIGNVEEIADALRTIRKVINSVDGTSSDKDLQAQMENTFRSINETLTAVGF